VTTSFDGYYALETWVLPMTLEPLTDGLRTTLDELMRQWEKYVGDALPPR
jgi:hypothetical protein